MSEQTQPSKADRSNSKPEGIILCGLVTGKREQPAADGKVAKWKVVVSYFGGTSSVSVSKSLFDGTVVNSYFSVPVKAGVYEGHLYFNALES